MQLILSYCVANAHALYIHVCVCVHAWMFITSAGDHVYARYDLTGEANSLPAKRGEEFIVQRLCNDDGWYKVSCVSSDRTGFIHGEDIVAADALSGMLYAGTWA